MKIPLIRPYFDQAEEQAVIKALRSGWLVQGPRVKAFEKKMAEYVGTAYAVATSSCTTALHLILLAAGIGPGDEVIVPSLSFIATANCILYCGAIPVFADIDPQTYNIDVKSIGLKLTKKTKAVIAVHQIGLCADIDSLRSLLSPISPTAPIIIEDAACALGATYYGKQAGSLGDAATFSFHPRKALTTGEGGMITTNRKDWAEKTKILRTHGMSVSAETRHTAKHVVIEEYFELGYNYRLTDLQAAIGLVQLSKFRRVIVIRRKRARVYTKAFKGSKHIIPPVEPKGYQHTFQSYQVRLHSTKKSRDQIMVELLEKGVATRRGVMASHLEPYYLKRFGRVHLPETEKAARETMILPLYPQMTDKEQEYVIENLLQVVS